MKFRVGAAKFHARFVGADKVPGQLSANLGFKGEAPDASGFKFQFAEGIDRGFVEQWDAGIV